jgi:hypothetical protein
MLRAGRGQESQDWPDQAGTGQGGSTESQWRLSGHALARSCHGARPGPAMTRKRIPPQHCVGDAGLLQGRTNDSDGRPGWMIQTALPGRGGKRTQHHWCGEGGIYPLTISFRLCD